MDKTTARKALDSKIASLPPLQKMQRPHKGWIRAVKEALGMSSKQLAARLGVSPPRVTALEKSEVDETVTLASLRRAAEALLIALLSIPLFPKARLKRSCKHARGALPLILSAKSITRCD